jgi:methylaspartate mutase sigma subunit
MDTGLAVSTPSAMRPPSLVLGVIGFDCHSVGNKILDAFFTEKGFQVTNLGVMVSQDEFISAAIETGADAILVSSLYGHGTIDCDGLRGRCIERGIGDIILYVGGNLVVGKTAAVEIERTFLEMGYDRVFRPDTDLEEAASLLQADIGLHRSKQPSLAERGA